MPFYLKYTITNATLTTINEFAGTEYAFNEETDLQLYTPFNQIYQGTPILFANNICILLHARHARSLLSVVVNNHFLALFSENGFVDYLTNNLAIFCINPEGELVADLLKKVGTLHDTPVMFVPGNRGRKKK